MLTTNRITLIAVLAAISVIGRMTFGFIPNFQPVTALIIISAFYLGPISAMFLAIVSTYVSNMVMGMGLWTVWQIIAWIIIAGFGSILGKIGLKRPLIPLMLMAILSGFFYGLIMSLVNYFVTGKFLGYYLAGIPFDFNHAVGNAIFIFIPLKSEIGYRCVFSCKHALPTPVTCAT